MRSRVLEVEAQQRRSVSVMGDRYCYLGSESYHYLGSGSGSCYFKKHYACHYLGACSWGYDAVTGACSLSTIRIKIHLCHVWQIPG